MVSFVDRLKTYINRDKSKNKMQHGSWIIVHCHKIVFHFRIFSFKW